jgi:16S rRNA (guanine1207-N2)-methyltransferase
VDRPAGGQYFAAQPEVASAPHRVRLALPDTTFDLVADRGVFSADQVDEGTRYLLGQGPAVPAGATHLVDLGCGYGPIALTLARRCPRATVWALDVNQRAVELTRANAAEAGLANVEALVVPEDPTQPVPGLPEDLVVDALWSNPPIRVGKARLHALLTAWLGRLAPDGSARLVVHKHLGSDSLARWLVEAGWAVERLSSRQGYRLLEVRRPESDPALGPGPDQDAGA